MRSFLIPSGRLDLVLIAFGMNFNLPKPDYIFQVSGGFEIVYTSMPRIDWGRVDNFVAEVWNGVKQKSPR